MAGKLEFREQVPGAPGAFAAKRRRNGNFVRAADVYEFVRRRPSGSAGGHHGLESIEQRLGTREYPRLRMGIGRLAGARQIAGHVLGRFDSTEAAVVDKVLNVAGDQAECWLDAGIQKAMNQFNGAVDGAETESEAK
jgi:hypothetical protein